MRKKVKAVCFGEVLFDVFPAGAKIGGAPLNVCVRLKSLGADVAMLSSVGADSKGKEITDYLIGMKVNTDGVRVNSEYGTGVVNVTLDEKGVAAYDISYPVAWDKIRTENSHIQLVNNCHFFVFGSLACRDEVSRATLKELLKLAPYKVFDANLRAPHYSKAILLELMGEADFIKLNDDELYEIAEYLGSPYHNMEQNIHFIADKTNTQSLCVTKGPFGAVLLRNGTLYYNSGYRIKVVDTVGSGDSFLASLIYKLFIGESPQEAIDFGCAMGALVAGNDGANPRFGDSEIKDFMHL